jgi:hypothetical protein
MGLVQLGSVMEFWKSSKFIVGAQSPGVVGLSVSSVLECWAGPKLKRDCCWLARKLLLFTFCAAARNGSDAASGRKERVVLVASLMEGAGWEMEMLPMLPTLLFLPVSHTVQDITNELLGVNLDAPLAWAGREIPRPAGNADILPQRAPPPRSNTRSVFHACRPSRRSRDRGLAEGVRGLCIGGGPLELAASDGLGCLTCQLRIMLGEGGRGRERTVGPRIIVGHGIALLIEVALCADARLEAGRDVHAAQCPLWRPGW